ncbi:hypothetical protein G5V57_18265 [Nordella sp. HKS 07]|nr:hypothetical protein [Nordella sp. HKS 07]QIG49483.1 hypothetical protein G5V57_18265 [Nordella sp. HKS 07]
MSYSEKPVGFAEVKAILDLLVKGREDDIAFVHGDAFGWADKAMLTNAVARPFGSDPAFRLIDPLLVAIRHRHDPRSLAPAGGSEQLAVRAENQRIDRTVVADPDELVAIRPATIRASPLELSKFHWQWPAACHPG